MRGRPPKRALTPDQERAADAFVGAAEATGQAEAPAVARPSAEPVRRPPVRGGARGRARSASADAKREALPWEEAYVREDVMKGYALRLPEPLYLKLKYVSEETGRSMNGLCHDAIAEVVEAELRRLL